MQQQQLQTEQAMTNANLNLEENSQRKVILNSLQGTRVFRGSALSRSLAGNNDNAPAASPMGAPSTAQINSYGQIITAPTPSLLDGRNAAASPGAASDSVASGGSKGGQAGGRGGGGARA